MRNYHPTIAQLLGIALLCAVTSSRAADWLFVPEPTEYATWPEHCRVQYSYIAPQTKGYGTAYPQSAIDAWRNRIGASTFIGIHHYCAALIYMNRIRLESDPRERAYLLAKALDDGDYTYTRADTASVVFPDVAIVMAQARFENKEVDVAIDILNKAIKAQPQRIEPYGALTAIYRKQNDLPRALAVLKKADTVSQGKSAEVKYNLGLLQLELKQFSEAQESARIAYELGHPLPGLRNKLRALGYPVPTSATPKGEAKPQ